MTRRPRPDGRKARMAPEAEASRRKRRESERFCSSARSFFFPGGKTIKKKKRPLCSYVYLSCSFDTHQCYTTGSAETSFLSPTVAATIATLTHCQQSSQQRCITDTVCPKTNVELATHQNGCDSFPKSNIESSTLEQD